MKNKGQALVEFVLILPILLIILMYIVDASKIISYKIDLENDMNVVVNLYESNKEELNEYLTKNNIQISYKKENNLTEITLKKQTKYTMPILKNILGNNIETKRTIYEQ